MNKLVNKFLLARDKIMPEIHLRQPGFTYTACETLTKNKERIEKFKETRDSRYQELAEELQKPIIRKNKKLKV